MSATLIPTKTAGARPPSLPPVSTTFDGSSDGGDSWIQRLSDEVRRICRFADAAEGEELAKMIGLIELRRIMVVRETMLNNALGNFPLPPLSDIPIDFLLAPSREQRTLQGFLNQLDECRDRCERRLSRYRFEVRLLEDLGTSDS